MGDMYGTYHSNTVASSSDDVPNTTLPAWIRLGKVGAVYGTAGLGQLKLAATLLAVVLVLVQREAAVAGALVRT